MLSEISYYLTLLSYDYPLIHFENTFSTPDTKIHTEKVAILYPLYRLLFQALQNRLSDLQPDHNLAVLGRIMIFLEFLKRLPLDIQQEITQGLPFPDVPYSDRPFDDTSSIALALTNTLKEELQKVHTTKSFSEGQEEETVTAQQQYSIENNYEAVKKGLFPVDIVVKKNKEIIAFIDLPVAIHYHDQDRMILRRKYRFKEFLYHHDYPNIPFLRYSFSRNSTILIEVANDILKKLRLK
jgi:hypothetical protein